MIRSCGSGRFVRDERGVWRYGLHGQPVSGAQDMTLTNFFNFPSREDSEGKFVEVQRGIALENADLDFCMKYDKGVGAVIDVPSQVWAQHDHVIGLWAPELQEEGGIRGMKFDSDEVVAPAVPGTPSRIWESPVAPHKPHDIRPMNASFRRHLRRKGWVPQEVDGTVAYWEPWREDPRETGPRWLPDPD